MAQIRNSGIDMVEEDLWMIMNGLRGKAIPAILNAGADVLIKGWKQQIGADHHRTGAMENAVDKTAVRYGDDGASIEVYPMGTDNHRITNAQKAFILHYGRQPNNRGHKAIKGDKFVDKAEAAVLSEVEAAMLDAMDRFIAGKE